MTPQLHQHDLIDIVLRRAEVREVNPGGTLSIIHSDLELTHFHPGAADVEVTVVGKLADCDACAGDDRHCGRCGGGGKAFR